MGLLANAGEYTARRYKKINDVDPATDATAQLTSDNARHVVVEEFDLSLVGGVTLFEGASLRVSHGRRYGLVGPNANGKGKSTLLKLLNWRKLPVPRNTSAILVVQEYNSKDPRPVIDVVLAADEELAKLCTERDELEASSDAASNGRLSESTLIVVSHEEGFLNAVCDEILHLEDKKLHAYHGNFDAFVRSYEQRKATAMKEHNKLTKAAQKGGRKAPKKWHDYGVEFHFPVPTELPGGQHLRLTGAGFRYFVLSGVDAGVAMGQRVSVVGPNGAGESTLVRLLAGELGATS
ncbi:hypothetical protein C2845_PM16G21790 [Panicum miliaceum]|uniref:ABC transporter domain-containing protein n=1 Tax=Panicum miliaceum TaxID=4540 RepID=A0A3L6PXL0_PANMI|nr:hypothetical protein C2845_PM16G21790 [Panicum miliaceum]